MIKIKPGKIKTIGATKVAVLKFTFGKMPRTLKKPINIPATRAQVFFFVQ